MNIDFNSWHPNQVHYENFRCRKLLGDEDFKKVKMPKKSSLSIPEMNILTMINYIQAQCGSKDISRVSLMVRKNSEPDKNHIWVPWCHRCYNAMMPWCHVAMMHHWCHPRWERRKKLNTSESWFELRPRWVKCSIGRSVRIGRLFVFTSSCGVASW